MRFARPANSPGVGWRGVGSRVGVAVTLTSRQIGHTFTVLVSNDNWSGLTKMALCRSEVLPIPLVVDVVEDRIAYSTL